jgi:hypothetical protein
MGFGFSDDTKKELEDLNKGRFIKFDLGPVQVVLVGEAESGTVAFEDGKYKVRPAPEGRWRFCCWAYDLADKSLRIMSGPKNLANGLTTLSDAAGGDLGNSLILIAREGVGPKTAYKVKRIRTLTTAEAKEMAAVIATDMTDLCAVVEWVAEAQAARAGKAAASIGGEEVPF